MPAKDYIFSDKTLRFFSHDEIYTLYREGLSVKQISRRLSRILGLSITAVTPTVTRAIYEHCRHPAVLIANSVFAPAPADDGDFTECHTPSPFPRSPRSWAVGDLCCRRR